MIVRKNRWKIEEQIVVLKRLGMLLDRGYSLNEGFEFVQIALTKHKQMDIEITIRKLQNGMPFYKVLEELKFHPWAISFAFFAEKNGNLATSLQTVSTLLLKRKQEQSKLKKLLTYPIFLLLSTFIMFIFILNELLPQFIFMYDSFSLTPNLFILFFFQIQQHPYIMLSLTIVLFLILLFILKQYKKRKTDIEIQVTVARLPILGRFLRLWHTYYLSYHISQLLKNGISLMECFQFIEKDPKKPYLKLILRQTQQMLLEGYQLDQAINRVPIWEKELGQVIFHGQLTGNLDIELEVYSHSCLERFFEGIEKIIKIAQPTIFGFIAIWIIFMYMSIMLPSFEIMNNL